MKRKMLVFTHKNHVYIYLGGCPFYTIEGFQERGFFFFKKQNQEMSFFFFFGLIELMPAHSSTIIQTSSLYNENRKGIGWIKWKNW